jgi:hypothetical protein
VTSSPSNGCALFSRGGDMVLMGQHKGLITIFDTDTRKILDVFKVRSGWSAMCVLYVCPRHSCCC